MAIPVPISTIRYFDNIQPWYRSDDYIQQMLYSWQGELDQFDRWLHYESAEDLTNVLHGDWLYSHEGVLAAWLARETFEPYLGWWEDMLGIPNDTTIPDSYRRDYLVQRMQQRGLSPTPQYIKSVAEYFVIQAAVVPHISTYTFDVRIIRPAAGVTPPQVLANLQAAIEAAKPAHLGWQLIQTEADWKTLATDLTHDKDWQNLGNADWSNVA